MRRLLLLIALCSCSRKTTEAQRAPEQARVLPEGFMAATGRGDDPIPEA
jgi:hypothetical protein